MLKGLPASGKSTWAAENRKALQAKIINKDKLRLMLDDGEWSDANEKAIILVRDVLAHTLLSNGKSVIIDDTNLAPRHEETLRQIAAKHSVNFVVQDFTHTPVTTCLHRDRERVASVGTEVIMGMWERYLKPKQPEFNPKLPSCILVDIDGTVAKMVSRKPFDWHKRTPTGT